MREVKRSEFRSGDGEAGDFVGVVMWDMGGSFATWEYTRLESQHPAEMNRFWGHYDLTRAEADRDFAEREARYLRRERG